MITIMIAVCLLGVANIAMCLILAKDMNKMQNDMERFAILLKTYSDIQQQIWFHSVFTNDAMELLLWKARQEVYTWQSLWVQAEQYEAAEQAKIVLQQMESMIKFHREQLKQNEKADNERTDEPTV